MKNYGWANFQSRPWLTPKLLCYEMLKKEVSLWARIKRIFRYKNV